MRKFLVTAVFPNRVRKARFEVVELQSFVKRFRIALSSKPSAVSCDTAVLTLFRSPRLRYVFYVMLHSSVIVKVGVGLARQSGLAFLRI